MSPFSPSFLSACAPFLHVCDVSSSCVVYDQTLSLNPKCWPRVIEISSASPSCSCGYVCLLTESGVWVQVSANVNKIWVSWRQVHGKSMETSTAFWGRACASECDIEFVSIGLCRRARLGWSSHAYLTVGRVVCTRLCYPSANGGPDRRPEEVC
jgi:hypothetical protein